jgi:hypothetical protein
MHYKDGFRGYGVLSQRERKAVYFGLDTELTSRVRMGAMIGLREEGSRGTEGQKGYESLPAERVGAVSLTTTLSRADQTFLTIMGYGRTDNVPDHASPLILQQGRSLSAEFGILGMITIGFDPAGLAGALPSTTGGITGAGGLPGTRGNRPLF